MSESAETQALEEQPIFLLGKLTGAFERFEKQSHDDRDHIRDSITNLHDSLVDRLEKVEGRLCHKIEDGRAACGDCRGEIDGRIADLDTRVKILEAVRAGKVSVHKFLGRTWQYVVAGFGFIALVLGILVAANIL